MNKKIQKLIDIGDGDSHNAIAIIYAYGKGVEQNYPKAVEHLKKACNLDSGIGCYNLGNTYQFGKGVKQSNSKALEYYGKACDLKNQKGCDNYVAFKDSISSKRGEIV